MESRIISWVGAIGFCILAQIEQYNKGDSLQFHIYIAIAAIYMIIFWVKTILYKSDKKNN